MGSEMCDDQVMRLDELDREILAALHADGRAPWPKIADDVGSSVSTVRRRYEALHGGGLIRVIGRTDVSRLGFGPPAMVKFHGPDALRPEFVERLRANPHVRFLASTVGSSHCLAEVVPRSLTSFREVLSSVVQDADITTESFVVTHTYTSGQDWLPVTARRNVDTRTRTSSIDLSADEHTILGALLRDGRATFSSLAQSIGRSENTARRIVESLIDDEVVAFRVLVEPELLGFEARFWTFIDIEPAHLPAAAAVLADNPATKTLFATAGRANLVGQFVLPRHTDTYAFTTEVLGTLPGARSTETLLEASTYKRVWNAIEDRTYREVSGPTWLFGDG